MDDHDDLTEASISSWAPPRRRVLSLDEWQAEQRKAGGGPIGQDFRIADAVRSLLSGSWATGRSYEATASAALTTLHGPAPGGGVRVPGSALRALTTSTAGSLATDLDVDDGFLATLQPASVAMKLGARIVRAQAAGHTVPTGTTSVATEWLAGELDPITESTPAFGHAAATPKWLGAYAEVSRRLLLQSDAEQVLRRELRNAIAAAIDAAVLAGNGASGQPLGIVLTPDVHTVTGAGIDQAALRSAQQQVSEANAIVDAQACGYVAHPGVAELLSTRQRFTGSDRTLWEGASTAGTVEGCRALSTNGCPADTLIFGDWSHVSIVEWDAGLSIAVDPVSSFKSGVVGMRLLVPVDVLVTRAVGFAIAEAVS